MTEKRRYRIVYIFSEKDKNVVPIRTFVTKSEFKDKYPDVNYNRKEKYYYYKKEGEEIKKEKVIERRERSQVMIYYKLDEDASNYGEVGFISVQAITLNPYITQQGLKIAVQESLNDLKFTKNINLSLFNEEIQGYEMHTPIGDNDEKNIHDFNVHVQITIFEKGHKKSINHYTK